MRQSHSTVALHWHCVTLACFLSGCAQAVPFWKATWSVDDMETWIYGGTGNDHGPADPERLEAYTANLERWETKNMARGGMTADRRGMSEVSGETEGGLSTTTYFGHVWSETDWHSEYGAKPPPRDTMGEYKVGPTAWRRGYLLDKKYFPPGAGIPKVRAVFGEVWKRATYHTNTNEDSFDGESEALFKELAGRQTEVTPQAVRWTAPAPRKTPKTITDEQRAKAIIMPPLESDDEGDIVSRYARPVAAAALESTTSPAEQEQAEKENQKAKAAPRKKSYGSDAGSTTASGPSDAISDITGADSEAPASKKGRGGGIVTSRQVAAAVVAVGRANEVIRRGDDLVKHLQDDMTVDVVYPKAVSACSASIDKALAPYVQLSYCKVPNGAVEGPNLTRSLRETKDRLAKIINLVRAFHPDKANMKVETSYIYLSKAIVSAMSIPGFKVVVSIRIKEFELFVAEVAARDREAWATAITAWMPGCSNGGLPSISSMCDAYKQCETAMALIKRKQTDSFVDENLAVVMASDVKTYRRFIMHWEHIKLYDDKLQEQVHAIYTLTCVDNIEITEFQRLQTIATDQRGTLSTNMSVYDAGIKLAAEWKDDERARILDHDGLPTLRTLEHLFEQIKSTSLSMTMNDTTIELDKEWIKSLEPVTDKLGFLYATTSARFQRSHCQRIEVITDYLKTAWQAAVVAVVTNYQTALRSLLDRCGERQFPTRKCDESCAKLSLTTGFDFAALAATLRYTDTEDIAQVNRTAATRTACATMCKHVCDLLGASDPASQAFDVLGGLIKWVGGGTAQRPAEWTRGCDFDVQFQPMAMTAAESADADIPLSYIRPKVLNLCWTTIGVKALQILKLPCHNLKVAGGFSTLLLAVCDASAVKDGVNLCHPDDSEPVNELRKAMKPALDAVNSVFDTLGAKAAPPTVDVTIDASARAPSCLIESFIGYRTMAHGPFLPIGPGASPF